MEAKTRYGEPIIVGHRYIFATVNSGTGYVKLKVTEILDEKSVRVDDHWHSTRWACNALCKVD